MRIAAMSAGREQEFESLMRPPGLRIIICYPNCDPNYARTTQEPVRTTKANYEREPSRTRPNYETEPVHEPVRTTNPDPYPNYGARPSAWVWVWVNFTKGNRS